MKKTFEIVIAAEECKGCGRCVNACSRNVLVMGKCLNNMGFPSAEVVRQDACVGCGICFYTCPEPGAVTVIQLTEEARHETQK